MTGTKDPKFIFHTVISYRTGLPKLKNVIYICQSTMFSHIYFLTY